MFFYLIGACKLIGPFSSSDAAWQHWYNHFNPERHTFNLLSATLPKDV